MALVWIQDDVVKDYPDYNVVKEIVNNVVYVQNVEVIPESIEEAII